MRNLKKALSLALCLLLTLTLLPSSAHGAEAFTTSEEGVAMIREMEGFRSQPYLFCGSWAIGYGHTCQSGDYPGGITEEQADALLMEDLSEFETIVNSFLAKNGIALTQYQFDALIAFTYNIGTQWMTDSSRIYNYLINGCERCSESEIVNAFAAWCHSGGEVEDVLVSRRLREAFLFLYGDYKNAGADAYTYIHFNVNGGSAMQPSSTVFYPVGLPYGELPVAVKSGSVFTGWYDSEGRLLAGEALAEEPITVTAAWRTAETDVDLSAWVNPYSDIYPADWYYTYVRRVSAGGVMNGYPDGTFRPLQTLTCGEALKLILLAAGQPDTGSSPEGHWASGYLAMAEALGCVDAGEIVSLDAPMTRGLVAKVAAVAMGLEPREGESPFIDADSGYLLALYEEGIVTGSISDGFRWFYPSDDISRAEICAIAERIMDWQAEEENDPDLSGYISYGDEYIPVLPSVSVCQYNPDLFVLDGSKMYYRDDAYVTELGIDVSSHQGEIDWQQVAASGVQFALLRVGFRGYGAEGTLNEDKYFLQNYEGAKAAGLKVGAYFYSQAVNTAEAAEEAVFVLGLLGGRTLDYPLVCDWETAPSSSARTKDVPASTVTDCILTFCQTVQAAGYTPMIYFNQHDAYERMELSRLTAYDSWYAQYADTPTMYYDYRIWQYSDSGSIPGVEGDVDMDLCFVPYG